MGINEDDISFEEFFAAYSEAQKQGVEDDKKPKLKDYEEMKPEAKEEFEELVLEIDTKIIDMLKLLEEYRKKCVEEGKYAEANKAKEKHEELRRKETVRQVNIIKTSQEQELKAIEEAQKVQFIEFSNAWDKYMSEYEVTALKSIDKLKVILIILYY